MKLICYVSFVDCPGPDILTATVLSGGWSSPHRWYRNMSSVSDFRASSWDHETREHHQFSEYSGFNQGSAGFWASKEHVSLLKARYQLMSGYSTQWAGWGWANEHCIHFFIFLIWIWEMWIQRTHDSSTRVHVWWGPVCLVMSVFFWIWFLW